MQFSVGFGIAYPQLVGMREPLCTGWAMVQTPALLFICFNGLMKNNNMV